MEPLNIVNLIEQNPITKLSSTYNSKLISKIKQNFTETQQQLFVSSFYCYLNFNQKNDFVIDLDNIWEWLGFKNKANSKASLQKHFTVDKDYKSLLLWAQEQKQDARGGHNKETIMLNIKTFKLFCIKAGTQKANEIHEYFIKLEEILYEVIQEESDELKKQLENFKVNSVLEKELLREKTILQQFPDNKQCVYYGLIDDKTDKGENLIKFGSSNFLCQRVTQHKGVYTNFRLVNAFKVDNKTHIENGIKTHPVLSKIRRTFKTNDKSHTELISIDAISFDELDKIIKKIIISIEYNPENYSKLLEENHRLKKELVILKIRLDGIEPENSIKSNELNNDYIPFVDFPLRVRRFQKAKDGKYYIDNICYEKLFGTRDEVWNGSAYKTVGELIKRDLVIGKDGKIISKNKHDASKLENRLQKNRPIICVDTIK